MAVENWNTPPGLSFSNTVMKISVAPGRSRWVAKGSMLSSRTTIFSSTSGMSSASMMITSSTLKEPVIESNGWLLTSQKSGVYMHCYFFTLIFTFFPIPPRPPIPQPSSHLQPLYLSYAPPPPNFFCFWFVFDIATQTRYQVWHKNDNHYECTYKAAIFFSYFYPPPPTPT